MSGYNDRNRRMEAALWEAVARKSGDILKKNRALMQEPCVMAYVSLAGLNAKCRRALFYELRDRSLAAAHDESRACALYSPSDTLEAALNELITRYDARAALSAPFDGGRLGHYVELMRLCMLAGERLCPNKRLYRFDELASSVFMLAARKRMDVSAYMCETVTGLKSLDKERNTELSRSLYEYLICFTDINDTAGKLDMHRNTFVHHLKKIEALAGGFLDDEKRFDMLWTYNLLALNLEGI